MSAPSPEGTKSISVKSGSQPERRFSLLRYLDTHPFATATLAFWALTLTGVLKGNPSGYEPIKMTPNSYFLTTTDQGKEFIIREDELNDFDCGKEIHFLSPDKEYELRIQEEVGPDQRSGYDYYGRFFRVACLGTGSEVPLEKPVAPTQTPTLPSIPIPPSTPSSPQNPPKRA